MNTYIEKIKTYLHEQTPDYGYADVSSLLEMLYACYTTHNPINNDRIRQCLAQQNDILSQLTLEENDRMFTTTSELCLIHERLAFLEGIQVGARLVMELTEMG